MPDQDYYENYFYNVMEKNRGEIIRVKVMGPHAETKWINLNSQVIETMAKCCTKNNERYCITVISDGLRMMAYPHNSYGTYATEEEARYHLVCIIANNSEKDIEEVLGDAEKVEIKPVDCYIGGDPMYTVFSD